MSKTLVTSTFLIVQYEIWEDLCSYHEHVALINCDNLTLVKELIKQISWNVNVS